MNFLPCEIPKYQMKINRHQNLTKATMSNTRKPEAEYIKSAQSSISVCNIPRNTSSKPPLRKGHFRSCTERSASFPSKLDSSFQGRPPSHRRIRSTGSYHLMTNRTKKTEAECTERTESHTDACDITKRISSKPALKKRHLRRCTEGSAVLSSALDNSSNGLPPNHRRTKSAGFNSIRSRAHNSQHKEYFVKDEYDDLIECIALRKSVHGEDHPEVALVHNSIGNCYNKRQDFEKSMNSYREALRIYRSFYGDYHPSVASTLQNIGNVHCRLGKNDLAIKYLEQSLLIRKKSQGHDHSDVANLLQNLGQVHALMGNNDQAMSDLEKALKLRSTQGEVNISVARNLSAIGNIYIAKGQLDEAMTIQRRSLDIKKQVLGTLHPSVAVSLMDLGSVCHKRGYIDEAISLYKEALRVQKGVYKDQEHYMDFGVTMHTIGVLHQLKGEIVKAKEALTNASSFYKEASLDHDHRCVIALSMSLETLALH